MFRTGLHRRLIALVAAYGLALQALLAVVVVLSPDAAAMSVICAGERGGAPARDLPATPHHGFGCALCALACAGGATPPASASAVAPIAGFASTIWHPQWAASIARGIVRAGFARGPPA